MELSLDAIADGNPVLNQNLLSSTKRLRNNYARRLRRPRMASRSTRVKIKLKFQHGGQPAGTVLTARSYGFGVVVLEGPLAGTDIGKAKYSVLKVLPEVADKQIMGRL